MKKIISFILICSILLALLTGCSYFDKTGEGGNETGDVEVGNNNGEKDNVTSGETEESTKAKGTPLDKESDVIESIINYIRNYYSDHDMPSNSLEWKLERIENEVWRPLEVTFDTFDYYFVCGYDNDSSDRYFFNRAKECNWYKFDSVDEIPEYYNGEKCAYVFQFNKASSIVNLLEGQYDVPKMEHFLWYQPEFKDGYNAKSPIAYGETIIYLCYTEYLSIKIWDEGTIYYSTSSYDYRWVTIPYVEFFDERYISLLTRQVTQTNGEENIGERDIALYFGKYSDDFTDVIEMEKYSIKTGYKTEFYSMTNTDYYSCISVEDFFKILNEKILN